MASIQKLEVSIEFEYFGHFFLNLALYRLKPTDIFDPFRASKQIQYESMSFQCVHRKFSMSYMLYEQNQPSLLRLREAVVLSEKRKAARSSLRVKLGGNGRSPG